MAFSNLYSSFHRSKASRLLILAKTSLMLIILLIFYSCLGTSNDEETGETAIHLKGRVVNEANLPMAGVVAKLSIKGLSDTTDMYGVYELAGPADDSVALHSQDEVIDTLLFMTNNQVAQVLPIQNYIDTNLPVIKIVQRDIRGQVKMKGQLVKGAWAVLLTGEGASTSKRSSEIWFNQKNGKFNGFLYFPFTNSKRRYRVYILLRGFNDNLLAMSDTLAFNDMAGDLDIEPFDSDNAYPRLSISADTLANAGQPLLLRPGAEEHFGGEIRKIEWDIGNTGTFKPASGNDTTIQLPTDTSHSYVCVLRVTDNENNVSTLQHSIRLIINKPIAKLKMVDAVRCDSLYLIDWSESQSGQLGEISKTELKIGDPGNFLEVSGTDTIVRASSTFQKKYPVMLRISDNFGNQVIDTQYIDFFKKWDTLSTHNFNISNAHMSILPHSDGLSLKGYESDSNFNFYLTEYSFYKNDQWTKVPIPPQGSGSEIFTSRNIHQQGDLIYLSQSNCRQMPDSVREPPEGLEKVLIISEGDMDSSLFLWKMQFQEYRNNVWLSPQSFYIFGEYDCREDYNEHFQVSYNLNLTSEGLLYFWLLKNHHDPQGDHSAFLNIFQSGKWEDIPFPPYVDTARSIQFYNAPDGSPLLLYSTATNCYALAKFQNGKWDNYPEIRVGNKCISRVSGIQFFYNGAFVLRNRDITTQILALNSSNQWQMLYESDASNYSTYPAFLEKDGVIYIVITNGSKPNLKKTLYRVRGGNIEKLGDRNFPLNANAKTFFFRSDKNQWRAVIRNRSTNDLIIYGLK